MLTTNLNKYETNFTVKAKQKIFSLNTVMATV